MMRGLLNILFITAFVLTGASPACAFISGTTDLIEICTNDGIERVAVDETSPQEDTGHGRAGKGDCGFCFMQSTQKSFKPATIQTSIQAALQEPEPRIFDVIILAHTSNSPHTPRGPPLLS